MKAMRKALRPLKRWYRRWIYRRWDLIIAVRDNQQPLFQLPRMRFDLNALTVKFADSRDEHYFADPDWRHMHAKFKDRIQNLNGFGCIIGIAGGKVVSQGPFVTGKYDDRGMGYIFDPGPKGLYWFEGETLPEWRSRGLALIGMNWLFGQLEELTGCDRIMTYYRMDNRASKRLHDRYLFIPQYRLIWRQLGPLKWTRKTPLPPSFGEGQHQRKSGA